jgi:acetoin utilization deacetylase AcuC-like enzyme
MMLKSISILKILILVGHTQALSLPVKILYDSSNILHRDIQYHPEQAARIDVCVKALSSYIETSSQNIELIDVSPDDSSTNGGVRIPFSDEQISHTREILSEIHTSELVESIEAKCHSSRDQRIEEGKSALGFIGYLDDDTYITTESYDVCMRAAACWIDGVDQVLNGMSFFHFALTRPPGHHATRTLPNGFCTFNFAAAAAVHGSKQKNCRKVTIIDWDVHYGQGIADIVEDYPDIRYVSMHQVPAFPYQGDRRGVRGRHKNIMTVPIAPDSTWTCGYRELFTEKVLPFCACPEWQPDLVIVCAGYDALASDELASCSLVAKDYGTMTRLLKEHSGSGAKIIFGLEGGYQLKANVPGGNLADAVVETIKALD